MDSARGPRAEEGAWELGPGFSIQVTSRLGQTLEDTWGGGGVWLRGRGIPARGGSSAPARGAVPKPARSQHSSSTSAIPGPTASFAAARAFGSTASGLAGLAPAPGTQDWAPRDEIRTRRLRRGPDRAAPRGPLRGVRSPQSSPNGNPARLGAEAGGAGRGAASLELAKVCPLAGRERFRRAPSRRGSAGGKDPGIRILCKWSG